MVEKVYMTWERFDRDVDEFVTAINQMGFNPAVILGLKRGGLPTATALSNKLNLPISLVTYQTRDGDDMVPKFLEPELIDNNKIILVDDIYDTGVTVENTLMVLESRFAVDRNDVVGLFHYASQAISTTRLLHHVAIESNNSAWCVFPWE